MDQVDEGHDGGMQITNFFKNTLIFCSLCHETQYTLTVIESGTEYAHSQIKAD